MIKIHNVFQKNWTILLGYKLNKDSNSIINIKQMKCVGVMKEEYFTKSEGYSNVQSGTVQKRRPNIEICVLNFSCEKKQ